MCLYMDIYDFEEDELREDIRKAMYGDRPMLNQNICIFNRLEILPKYRGLGLGKRIIKENIEHIAYACGLIVIKPFPLQLENEHLHSTDFEKSMGFELMEKDEHKAFTSLRSYYESIGYQSVKSCPNFMFMVPSRARTFLKDIDLEGYNEALDTEKVGIIFVCHVSANCSARVNQLFDTCQPIVRHVAAHRLSFASKSVFARQPIGCRTSASRLSNVRRSSLSPLEGVKLLMRLCS